MNIKCRLMDITSAHACSLMVNATCPCVEMNCHFHHVISRCSQQNQMTTLFCVFYEWTHSFYEENILTLLPNVHKVLPIAVFITLHQSQRHGAEITSSLQKKRLIYRSPWNRPAPAPSRIHPKYKIMVSRSLNLT